MKALLVPVVLLSLAQAMASRPPDVPFRIHPIDPGASETAAVADVNRDGRLDIISGEHWYQAPALTSSNGPAWPKHRFRELGFSNNYVDNFSDLVVDVDADDYPDVVSVSWFAKKVAWWRNPGKGALPGKEMWKEATIHDGFNVEFAVLVDLDNDGKALEVLAQENGTGQAWYEVKNKAWVAHVVSDRSLRPRDRCRGRQRRQAQRHPHAARMARGAGRSARRQLDVSSRLGSDQRARDPFDGLRAGARCGGAKAGRAPARQRARVHARARRQR